MDGNISKEQQIEAMRWILSIAPLKDYLHALDILERDGMMTTPEHNSLVDVATLITMGC